MNRLAVAATLMAAALSSSAVVPANAGGAGHLPRPGIKSSDYRVASGEQFIVHGRIKLGYNEDEIPAPPSTVQVQTRRHGDWTNVRGARVKSKENGRYRVRVILRMRGERKLRVHTKTPGFFKWVNSRTITEHVR
ncbi:MAG: hypothetical protein ACRDO7_13890 [Nocardioidaceae bacterium]